MASSEASAREFLVGFAVGPVQRFIAEARKAQDIWSGSLVLSHLTLALMQAVEEQKGQVKFPAGKVEESPERPKVTNEVLATLTGTSDEVKTRAKKIAEGGRQWWKDLAGEVRSRLLISGDPESLHLFCDVELLNWDGQIAAAFEISWAAVPLSSPNAFKNLHALLGAAKRSRQALSWVVQR